MKLTDVDLNLLVVFHHLMRERGVSRTADALGLSQPAVSNALARLRRLLGDELFLRTATGMAPTPYAQELACPVAQALETLHGALNVRTRFEPATSRRCFTLALTDVGEIYFLPVLMEALADLAPGVTLRCVPVADPGLREDMAAGRVDLALGALPSLQAGFYQQALFRQRHVALMRADHPLTQARRISAAQLRQTAQVRVAASGTDHGRLDEWMAQRGVSRPIQLTVPHYVALGQVLSDTRLMAIVPERFATRVCQPFGLVSRPLALTLPTSVICQYWHSHLHRDAGHQWLRHLMASRFGTPEAAETTGQAPSARR